MKKKNSSFTMNMDDTLRKALDDIATREDKSTGEIVRVAVRAFCYQKRLLRLRQISQWRD